MMASSLEGSSESSDVEKSSDNSLCLKQNVLFALANTVLPLKTLDLASTLDIGKSRVNTILYDLLHNGKVKRTLENPPLWTYNRQNDNGREDRLLELMRKHMNGISTTSIARSLHYPKAAINRILYNLEQDGVVERLQLAPPIWKMSSKSPASLKKRPLDIPKEGTEVNNKRLRLKLIAQPAEVAALPSHPSEGVERENMLSSLKLMSQPAEVAAPPSHPSEGVERESIWSKECAHAVWKKFRSLQPDAKDNEILAGFVVKHADPKQPPRVVSIGTGTKCVPGDKLSLQGTVVHDSHAEIVARRSLIRWLYAQIKNSGSDDSFAMKSNSGETPFELRPFELWLYTSQAPCGDASLFSRADLQPKSAPCYTHRRHGLLRLKVEGEICGSSMLSANADIQTFDGIQHGDRAKSHSCSDKLARWGVLGVQGALLSRLMPPLYMTGVIVGDVFAHGHICRALCCRSEKAIQDSKNCLEKPYKIDHLRIGHAPINVERSTKTKKRGASSINWAEHDNTCIETANGTIGRLADGCTSRISKVTLFECFCQIEPSSRRSSYKENKALARDYQLAKQTWTKAMEPLYGRWLAKPPEVDEFYTTKELQT